MNEPSIRAYVGFFLLLAMTASNLLAGGVTTAKTSNRESLRVTYTPDPDGTVSMSEIVVTVAPIVGPCLADRDLEVVIYMSNTYYGSAIAYSAKVFLPEGAASATVRIDAAQTLNYGMWVFDVHEDGRSIIQPRAPVLTTNNNGNNQNRKTILEVGFDNASLTDPENRLAALTANNSSTILISQAPTCWQGYLGYEFVIISARSLEVASIEQAQALSDYVLAGGSLIVRHANSETPLIVDRQFRHLDQLSARDNRWQILKSVDRNFGFTRPHGGGVITVYENLSPNWQDLVKQSVQYPVSDLSSNSSADQTWFWKNLVLSVGRTPIWGFVAFVTVFVFVVGPVMIRFTDRLRQRTLLLVLVPAFSLSATIMFLLFNITRDGFSTRGRVAAVHYFDVPTGQGFSWSRQSYFSGAPPRRGLKFVPRSFIRPRDEETSSYRGWRDPRERVVGRVQQDSEATVLSSWMTTRSQQSFLIGSPVQASLFPISARNVNEETVSIKNESVVPLPIVVLKNSAGLYFCAQDLAAGETREVLAESSGRIDSELRTKRIDLEPKPPKEVDPTWMPSGRGYYYGSQSAADPIDNSLRNFSVSKLPNDAYWIVSQQTPLHPLPFTDDVYKKEKHFLIMTGAYQW